MFETARPFLLAVAIGLLIGIERERAKADAPTQDPLGSRTFSLLALLGAIAAHVAEPLVAVVLAAFAGAIVLAGYFRTRLGPEGSGVGVTTEVAAMATFMLGYLARHEPALTVMLAVIALVLLALKARIHEFARAGLSENEVNASLVFLVLAFVILPLLPDEPVDPWGLVNPARLWLLFVLIVGISFGGYIAVRLLGARRGFAVAGFFAGMVSSTAATVALARRAREVKGATAAAATGIVLANVASAAAQILVVAVIYPEMLQPTSLVVGAPVVTGLLGTAGALWVLGPQRGQGRFEFGNPLALRASGWVAVVLGAVILGTSIAGEWFGTSGVLAAAALGGAGNVHAVALAVSTLAASGTLAVREAVLAILVGFVANMLVKLGLVAWAGGRWLLVVAAPPLVGMMLAGVAAYAFVLG